MSTATLASPAVAEFSAAVRAALSDLSSEEIDDLTDGLEADLTDRLSESGEAELGDPSSYAEELRSAAGLPHRAARRPGVTAELRKVPGAIARDVRRYVAERPMLTGAAAFLIAIRPAWWVFRAAAVTALIAMTLGGGPVTGVTVIAGIVVLIVSVQFGRGRWLPFAWMRGLLLAVNIVLAIATPFVLAGWVMQLSNAVYSQQYPDSYPSSSNDGLMQNGNQVSNIFAYDAQGNPLTNVQLFDQDGKPLNVGSDQNAQFLDDGTGGLQYAVPNDQVAGRQGWNVFPLEHVGQSSLSDDGVSVAPLAHRIPAELPFATTRPLAGSDVTGGPSGQTPAPTAAPTPAPTAAPAP